MGPGLVSPTVVLLDLSRSVAAHLHELVRAFREGLAAMKEVPELKKAVELVIVGFGGEGARVLSPPLEGSPFVSVVDAVAPGDLVAGGHTPIGEALQLGLDLFTQRSEDLYRTGRNRARANLLLYSDGRPTNPDGYPDYSSWIEPVARVHEAEHLGRLLFSVIAFGDADAEALRRLARTPEAFHDLRDADLPELVKPFTYQTAGGLRDPAAEASTIHRRVGDIIERETEAIDPPGGAE
jgi:uncharacterized protein YegL